MIRAPRAMRFAWIGVATVLLFVMSPLIAPGSLDSGALAGMVPFAAALALIAVGQTLVLAQGGIDLSVPAIVGLAAVVVTKFADGDDAKLPVAVVLTLVVAAAFGLVNGIATTKLNITPFVVTLATNSAGLGVIYIVSNEFPTPAAPALTTFMSAQWIGVPTPAFVAVAVVAVAHVLLKGTTRGRVFLMVGANRTAAATMGIRTDRYVVGAYVLAAVCYAVGAIILAGWVRTPTLFIGDQYLLPSIAATVLGGTAMTGGIASVLSSSIGAVFLTQLSQVVLAAGASTAGQRLVEALVLAAGIAVQRLRLPRALTPAGRTRRQEARDAVSEREPREELTNHVKL
ncbi:ABC transporter permease [Nocardioides sp. LMS-CY]|uniref:ABC transporter permease n=1 Tax=Nocardioides sp. (strain LMS-CY) TaxID=2840457 RepID=UPI001BFFE96F|nr:ABC transporter permease [Nocardioides sp. LMS-CY]QWF20740.1 ABC transporter permease [Nocardioides sp. LMS-CY]